LPRKKAAVDWMFSPKDVCFGDKMLGEGSQFGAWVLSLIERGAVVAKLVCTGGESLSGEEGDAPVAAPNSLRTPFIGRGGNGQRKF